MGNTCSSVHIVRPAPTAAAIDAIVRAYGTLGFERVETARSEGKHVLVRGGDGEAFLSVYDSDNAALDSGELKALALAASKILGTAAVCTSLYDSDTFELVLFNSGKQVDLVMTEPEQYRGPLKSLSAASRSKQWSRIFGRPLSAGEIEQAATRDSVFADDALAELSRLIGLTGGQSQLHFRDVEHQPGVHRLHFIKQPAARAVSDGHIVLRNYFDPDNSRMLMIYPASWPAAVSDEVLVTWLLFSEGAGFSEGTLAVDVEGPDGLTITRGYMDGARFHNSQIVGPLETAPRELAAASAEDVLNSKAFEIATDPSASPGSRTFTGRFPPTLNIPAKAPDRPTQILMIVQLQVAASRAGEWELHLSVRPASGGEFRHDLPRVRLAAVERTWLPLVSGLNPKATYDTSDLAQQPRGPLMITELRHKQAAIGPYRTLDHFAIAGNVAILEHDGQATLDACRSYLEGWLRRLADRTGEIRIHAEKRMTERAYVGKSRKTLPAAAFQRDKAWQKLFDVANHYQTVLVSIFPDRAEFPIAGVGVQVGLEQYPEQWRAHYEQQLADTLSRMRGRPFEPAAVANTVHVFNWVLNHADCYGYMGTSAGDMKDRLDDFAARHPVLQAWHSQYTWRPLFDQADDYHRTVYEDHSVLNWFRGILQNDSGLDASKMSLQWCRNVLRMVTPHMWICRALIDQVDRAALDNVARVTRTGDAFRLTLREGHGLDDLELALLPVLPMESARVRKR